MTRKYVQLRPLVSVNRDSRRVFGISIDVSNGGCQAVEHPHIMGFRSLTYLDWLDASCSGGIRWWHIFNECEVKRIIVKRSPPYAFAFHGGYSYAEKYMDDTTREVIVHNDLMSIELIVALKRLGCECFRNVSVIGFDDDTMSIASNPHLTAIHVSLSALGWGAADLLLQSLMGASSSEATPTVATRLIVRQSTGARLDKISGHNNAGVDRSHE